MVRASLSDSESERSEEEYDFGSSDSSVPSKKRVRTKTNKPSKKRKNEEESDKNIFRRRKKASPLQIRSLEESTLQEQVQKWIQVEWPEEWVSSTALRIRENARQLLRESFQKDVDFKVFETRAEFIVHSMEKTAFERWFVFQPNVYASRIRSVSYFIETDPLRFLSMDPTYSITMNDRELAGYKEDNSSIRNFEEFMKSNRYGSEITCQKCKKKTVFYFGIQIRGSDEPQTIFYECQNETCKHRWREG